MDGNIGDMVSSVADGDKVIAGIALPEMVVIADGSATTVYGGGFRMPAFYLDNWQGKYRAHHTGRPDAAAIAINVHVPIEPGGLALIFL